VVGLFQRHFFEQQGSPSESLQGLLRIQPASSRDEPAEGAGDGGVGGELRIEELAGHDGAGERNGAGAGEDADEPEGGADGDG
jgi:hypothetical protein